MNDHPLNPSARNLEEEFFLRENQRLLVSLRDKAEREEQRAALHAALPRADNDFIDHLIDMGIRAETALAMVLAPLVLVAWADGSVDGKEREAIMKGAAERGVTPGTPAGSLLTDWLDTKPEAGLLRAWSEYVRTVCSDLDETERRNLHDRILELARGVAEAAGGFLGLTSKISTTEQAVLDDLEEALR